MNAASRLSHIPHVCRRAALLAALIAALAQPAWAQNSGGHVEQDGSDYIYVGDTSPVTLASPKAEYGGTTVTLNHVYGGKSDAGDVKGWNLTLKGTAVVVDNAYGGWIGGSSDLVSENLVRLEGGAEVGSPSLPGANSDGGNVYGGYSANQYKAATADAATNNTVVLAENAQVFSGNSSPQQNGHVFGGYAVTGSVAHNKVRIEGGGTPGTGGVLVEGDVTANHAEAGNVMGARKIDQPDVYIEAGGG
ncbi:MAG: hypothetical protein IJM64_09630 [Ottowia sp.]|nr:hypothetical protein [Ottowia sp.]